MGKLALLIGVSDYTSGLQSLQKAVLDVEKLEQILKNPEIGGFEKVDVLKNPDRQSMEVKLEEFLADSKRDDLLLVYFSGHGVVDEVGNFYLSSRSTCLHQNRLRTATAVKAKDIHSWLSNCKSKRQVVILDCCNAGAFAKGLTSKGNIDIRAELGGEGRAVLAAATSTQYAFEQEGLDLSIYTHYLAEGLEKGAADLDGDGQISVEELHEYVFKKVKEAAPAMTPEIYNLARDTEPILIARSPKDDPKLKYRKEVEKRCDQGQFTIPGRRLLKRICLELKLDLETAEAIEAEVLQPWRERERKLQEYREILEETLEAAAGNLLSDRTWQDLQDYQTYLGLRNEDIRPIHAELLPFTSSKSISTDNYYVFRSNLACEKEIDYVKLSDLLARGICKIVPFKVEQEHIDKPVLADDLVSEKGIDYTKLRDLLAIGDWKEADQETYRVMIRAVGKKEGNYFSPDELRNFPCADLNTIDSLWVKYSKGYFGFSVQKKIWQECSSPTSLGAEWNRFCVRVGWQKEATNYMYFESLKFDPRKSLKGELPAIGVWWTSDIHTSYMSMPPLEPFLKFFYSNLF